MARRNLKPGTLLAPLPAVMVSVGNMDTKNIITVAWCGILSTDPPRAYISVRPTRHSYRLIRDSGEFVINLTSEDLALATDYSGIYTGAKVDKFEKCGLHASESLAVSAPSIKESPLSLECKVFEVIESGTHHIFLADIVNVSCREDMIDDSGRLCYEKAGLLVYAHGEYFALGKKIGKFGYSTDKKNKSRIKERTIAGNATSESNANIRATKAPTDKKKNDASVLKYKPSTKSSKNHRKTLKNVKKG